MLYSVRSIRFKEIELFSHVDEKISIKAVRISQVLISQVLTKMLEIQNRLEIKQKLLSEIEQLKSQLKTVIDYPQQFSFWKKTEFSSLAKIEN